MENTLNLLSGLAQMIISLALVCGLIFLVFRYILPRLSGYQFSNNAIRIVERANLDAKKSLCVIEVGGSWMLIAASDTGITLLRELADDEIAEIERKMEARAKNQPQFGNFGVKLSEMITKKEKKL